MRSEEEEVKQMNKEGIELRKRIKKREMRRKRKGDGMKKLENM